MNDLRYKYPTQVTSKGIWRSCYLPATAALLALGSLFAVASQSPQNTEDTSRKVWNKQFEAARSKAGKRKPGSRPQRTAGESLIGVTIWRLRDALSGEANDNPRLLSQKDQSIPERVGLNTTFREKDRVRLNIEVPRVNNHYLYVIDREVYADGAMSEPYLIFPNKKTRDGDNTVWAGKLIQIPPVDSKPPYFNFTSLRKDRVQERLTILVSPQPLALPLSEEPLALNASQVAQWEKQWGGVPQWREPGRSLSLAWTEAESEAVAGSRLLSQGDPLPQTMFRAKKNRSGHLLIVVMLRVEP